MKPDKLEKTEKPWGYETLIAHTEGYAMKLIQVNKGARLSLQTHNKKTVSK